MSDNSIYNPPVGFYFKLGFTRVSAQTDATFQEASGISMELETREVAEGGENRFRYKLPEPGKYSNLVLKRGLVDKGSPLAIWCIDTLTGALDKAISPKTITVSLLEANSSGGKPSMVWEFVNAYPVKWSISDLQLQNNMLVIESLEFAYNYFQQSTTQAAQ